MSNESNDTPVNAEASVDTTWQQMEQRREALHLAVSVDNSRISEAGAGEIVAMAEAFRTFLVGEPDKDEDIIEAPTEPGFYKYSGGRQKLLFLLDSSGNWYTWFDNGEAHHCGWGYIEQALSVWDLEKIE